MKASKTIKIQNTPYIKFEYDSDLKILTIITLGGQPLVVPLGLTSETQEILEETDE